MNITLIIIIVILIICCILQFVLINKLAKGLILDAQTELKNYHWFKKRVELLLKKREKVDSGNPLSIAILDIDNFRRFNKIGIRFGDEVLYEFATHLNNLVVENTGTHNLVRYRLGDEFAIIFENQNKAQAEVIMKKIQTTFVENFIKTESHPEPIFITFTYGLAQYRAKDTFVTFTDAAEHDLVNKKAK